MVTSVWTAPPATSDKGPVSQSIETLQEFADIRRGGVGQEEFASARDDLLRKLPSQFETNGPGSRLPVRPGHEAVVSTSNHGR